MAFESFYGGPSGTPFIIVKRFDGIDIPQPGDGSGVVDYTYTSEDYAVDKNENFIIENGQLITKTSDNYGRYEWKNHVSDGSPVEGTDLSFPRKLAEGMVQHFKKGAASSSEVNYGEYVIIDTVLNMHSTSNPDNGKVFRRGFDLSNELGGAEYIGQIVGPKGETPELNFTTYEKLTEVNEKGDEKYNHRTDKYDLTNQGIIPGSYMQDGERVYEDKIKYAWTVVRDEFGSDSGCLIGFKIPVLVQDFIGKAISPYEGRKKDENGNYYYEDLISADESQFNEETQTWKHPFFHKWNVKIPCGYHGTNVSNLEIIPTYTKPIGFQGSYDNGVALYTNKDCTEPYLSEGQPVYLKESHEILRDEKFDSSEEVISAIVEYNGQELYVKKADCYKDVMRYKETDFEDEEAGKVTYYEVGEYNTIRGVTLSESGILTVFYSANSQPEELEQALRWIDTKNSKGIEIDDDGTVHVYYNTLDGSGEHEHQDYPTVLDWITEATLTQDGKFTLLYNNDTVKVGQNDDGQPIYGNKYTANLNWVDKVDILEDGTVQFYFNSNHTTPAFEFTKKIQSLIDVQIETSKENDYEGSGDQKIHIKYNTTDEDGNNIVAAIGNPLNYIVESCISTPNDKYPLVPFSHLLVYYSDPELRKKYQKQWVRYPSTKVIDSYITNEENNAKTPVYHVWDEWVDLGEVKGETGGLQVLTVIDNVNKLRNDVPPEQMENAQGVINPDAAGWGVIVATADTSNTTTGEFYFYDYGEKKWKTIGTAAGGLANPKYAIALAEENADSDTGHDIHDLFENGIWLVTKTVRCI